MQEVAADADPLSARCGLSSRLTVDRREPWGVLEVVAEGGPLPPYQAAAVAAARLVWSA
ncbi:hypothetical protein ACFOVU_16315 [Nocardiopsis sediminis]|uniref:Uncharacterized protein n=1 Tax=Nocardiopsis sediminis TaxID=1778267 RepID=A0ABV8FR14_9ACTN